MMGSEKYSEEKQQLMIDRIPRTSKANMVDKVMGGHLWLPVELVSGVYL